MRSRRAPATRTWARAGAALLVGLLASRGVAAWLDPLPSACALAAVDGAGTLVPIGRFAGGEWHAAWPEVDEQHLPRSLDAVPRTWLGMAVPREWTFWPADDGPPAPLSIVAPVYAGSCVGTLGFTTTITPLAADGSSWAGIAIDAPVDVSRPMVLAEDDPAAGPVMQLVRGALRDALRREAATWPANVGARAIPSGNAREAVELLRAHTAGSRSVVFARATATYDEVRFRDGVLPFGVRLTAWLDGDLGAPNLVRTHAESFSPGDDKARRQRPLAVLAIDGREFWVLEQLYYESMDFGIVEVSPGAATERVAAASPAGC